MPREVYKNRERHVMPSIMGSTGGDHQQVMTTSRADGLRKLPWGMSQAEPIGSSKSLQPHDFHRHAPKEAIFYLEESNTNIHVY